MTLLLLYRKSGINYSIERVFDVLLEILQKDVDVYKVTVPYYKIKLLHLLKNMCYCYRRRKEINHITGDVHYCGLLLPSGKTILTIHDTVSLTIYSGFYRVLIYLFWYYWPLRSVKYVTCISEKTKAELLRYFPWAEKKIRVIYNPVSPDYVFLEKVLCKEIPKILHIGTRENKNLFRVIQALHNISCELRIIGELTEEQIAALRKYGINYIVKTHLTDNEIVKEYRECDIVSFPSIYEGFGMPIIEGQATGRVVLTSDIAPMNEIAGEAAWFVNPYDVESIRNGFIKLINDAELRNELITKGKENVKRFAVEQIAADYLNLYREVFNG